MKLEKKKGLGDCRSPKKRPAPVSFCSVPKTERTSALAAVTVRSPRRALRCLTCSRRLNPARNTASKIQSALREALGSAVLGHQGFPPVCTRTVSPYKCRAEKLGLKLLASTTALKARSGHKPSKRRRPSP